MTTVAAAPITGTQAVALATQPRPASTVVPLERTRTNTGDIRQALASAVQTITGHDATPGTLDVLVAHVSHETDRGQSMYNFNFGGIKGTSPSGLTAVAGTREVIDGQDVHTRAHFRAYSSLDEGAQDYVSLLVRRYPAAVNAAQNRDVDGFSHALCTGGYYTETEASYTASMRRLAGLPAEPAGTATVAPTAATAGLPTEDGLARVLSALNDAAARIAAPTDEGSNS